MSKCCAGVPEEKQVLPPSVQCACQKSEAPQSPSIPSQVNKTRYFGIGIAALVLWSAVYSVIVPLSQWLTYDLFSIDKGTPLGDSVEFFFYDTAKILLLLVLMVYVIGWLRAAMHVERVRDYLAGKGRGIGLRGYHAVLFLFQHSFVPGVHHGPYSLGHNYVLSHHLAVNQ